MNLRVHCRALEEIDHEVDYYESWKGDPNRRVALLDRFPFTMPYEILGDTIVVLALAHTSRRPGYWTKRRAER